jgi:hypothetical protein
MQTSIHLVAEGLRFHKALLILLPVKYDGGIGKGSGRPSPASPAVVVPARLLGLLHCLQAGLEREVLKRDKDCER